MVPLTTLTFYGGVNEIGGNKILLEDKGTKIFLDFGMSFGKNGMYFDKFMKPRTVMGIKDYIEMGLIPDLEGVYRDDLIQILGRKPVKPDIDAVLLTHAHADHANYISFLHEEIPVYMGETCRHILEAIKERTSRNLENEILDYKPRNDKKADEIKRDVRTFRTGKKFKIGSIEVEPLHVDHSVPGAYGFILHTTSGAIVYTGDIRLHGTKPEMTLEFVKKAKKVKPVALITEGTRINDLDSDESEQKVYQDCKQKVQGTKKLVFADFSIKDVDRLRTFYKIAKESGRRFVIPVDNTPYLKHLSKDPQLKVPKPDDANIDIFIPKKSTYKKYEKEYFDNGNAITTDEISKKGGKYLCAFAFWDFSELIDIKPEPGSLYVRSLSEPYSEEMELDQDRVNNWLKHFSFEKFQSHCSGHSKGKDLLEIVSEINAKTVYPVHTENADMFKKVSANRILIDVGHKYKL